jgi:hypothetical protein
VAFDLDDAEYEISYLKREIGELRENLAKMIRLCSAKNPYTANL